MNRLNQSLAAYAKSHCACWSDTIGCFQTERITCDQRGTLKAETGKCLVAQSKPCQYFQERQGEEIENMLTVRISRTATPSENL